MLLSKPYKNFHAEDEPECITSENQSQDGELLIRTDTFHSVLKSEMFCSDGLFL